MKILLMSLLNVVLMVTLAQAAAFSEDVKFRSIKVHISSDKPLTTGLNVFVLEITKDAKALVDTKVMVKAFMPAMPTMPAMESSVQAKDLGNGRYEVRLNIAMQGTWQIHIFITPLEGKRSRIKTSIDF